MFNNYKKYIIILLFSIFGLIITVKFSISFFKNEIINIIKSDKFDVFIINILDKKIEKIANTEISEDKKNFYKNNLEKIINKFE